ncbi:MAG: protoporphyrinogen oxidase [Gemmatimonadaceae bacterium]|nr:protoporphyrinogen oxidase [Gemmatimonadaceae bacterium]
MPHVVVCGAGLTGLTTAWYLRRAGASVTIVEASDAVGGVMGTTRRDGYLVEHGPNSAMLTAPMAQLVDALGLTPQLRVAAPQAQRRYIVRAGRALAVPASPGAMLRSPLFSLGAKLRLLAEPFISRRHGGADESVASFVRRRLGREPLTWAVDPFVSGVYAGDPEHLSVTHAFPRLAALEREHGSLVRGMIAGARKSRVASGEPGLTSGRATMVSFADGMGTLPQAIAHDLTDVEMLLGTRVTAIDTSAGVARVEVVQDGDSRMLDADAVVSTVPTHAFAAIRLPAAVAASRAQLASLPYPAVSSLALGFRRADVSHALDGFGCLIPSAERRDTLGVLFSSTLFDGRAPEGDVLLTCFVGGVRHPAWAPHRPAIWSRACCRSCRHCSACPVHRASCITRHGRTPFRSTISATMRMVTRRTPWSRRCPG